MRAGRATVDTTVRITESPTRLLMTIGRVDDLLIRAQDSAESFALLGGRRRGRWRIERQLSRRLPEPRRSPDWAVGYGAPAEGEFVVLNEMPTRAAMLAVMLSDLSEQGL